MLASSTAGFLQVHSSFPVCCLRCFRFEIPDVELSWQGNSGVRIAAASCQPPADLDLHLLCSIRPSKDGTSRLAAPVHAYSSSQNHSPQLLQRFVAKCMGQWHSSVNA